LGVSSVSVAAGHDLSHRAPEPVPDLDEGVGPWSSTASWRSAAIASSSAAPCSRAMRAVP